MRERNDKANQPPNTIFKSYHPTLPSIEEAKNSYDLVTSDHVPFLMNAGEIKVISWNVLESDAANGFAPLGQSSYGESKPERQNRYVRIAEGLLKFANNHSPDLICLQEIAGPENEDDISCLFSVIQYRLPQYSVILNKGKVVDAFGNITFYNSKTLEPTPDCIKWKFKQFKYSSLEGCITEYIKKDNTKLKVRIANVHAPFKTVPVEHEAAIREFLQQETNCLPIIVGDFNCSIAPLNDVPRNIVTSATVSTFRDNRMQGACAIDGGFYSRNDGFHQADIQQLDWNSGKIYSTNSLNIVDVENLPDLQKEEILKLNMIIVVDEKLTSQKLINEQYSTKEYQTYLMKEFCNDDLIVRIAKNLINQKGIGIIVPKDFYRYLEGCNLADISLRVVEDGIIKQYAIYASTSHVPHLMKLVNDFCNQNKTKSKNYNDTVKEVCTLLEEYKKGGNRSLPQIELCNKIKKHIGSVIPEVKGKNHMKLFFGYLILSKEEANENHKYTLSSKVFRSLSTSALSDKLNDFIANKGIENDKDEKVYKDYYLSVFPKAEEKEIKLNFQGN